MDTGAETRPPSPGAPAAEWIAFDRVVRRTSSWSYTSPVETPEAVKLCHPDGRIREAALRAPKHLLSPLLEFAAIRCADWVPAVRAQARQVLARALADDPAGTLHRLTPLVVRLGRREQGAWALERFEDLLNEDHALLAELRGSPDPRTRRFAARLTLGVGLLDVRELAALAATEPDPATSGLWTDATLAALAADGPDDEAVDTLLGGHGQMVRAAGVTALRGAGRAAEAADHLCDRSGMVRACARWLVRQAGGDPRPLCREPLADPARVTPYAVTAFAECARREDAPLLRALLAHPAGQVRAAAVGGLRLLDVTDVELLRPLLDDPAPAVAREVARSLGASADRLPADWLMARIEPGRPSHTRRAAYRLLFARGGVAGLRASVALLTDRDPALRTIAAQRVQSMWSPNRPPDLPARDPEVGALLDRCTHLFSDHVMRRMRYGLGLPVPAAPADAY
ncbi:HEAT repeat domain-containing protein [Streptomyces virginiae]|uniref:HEAT repeat domain-containing protein n=1 Tax=Streptomyces virginiae TaxID=1961 RepID=UPI002DD979E2|nr:HEAT repeat domain-containing protein [Streptomyces virginiae]WSC76700.1 HEAT repeat domain-containing protein [Streptomyces virginiae]